MAVAGGTDAATHVDDTKLGDEGIADGAEEVGERVSLLVSSFNLSKSPILERMDAVLIRAGDSLLHVLKHRETFRRFEIRVTNDDLVPLGFNPRDTLEDCFDILKDAYEKDGTQTRIRRTLAVTTVAITQMRTDDAVLGEPKFIAAAAAADDPVADSEPDTDTRSVSFEDCGALKVEVIEDIGRRAPLRYVLLLTDCAMAEGFEDKRAIAKLKARVQLLEMELKLSRITVKAKLTTVGFLNVDSWMRRMWSMDSADMCQFFSLSEDRCSLVFRERGVYTFAVGVGKNYEYMYVNSNFCKYGTGLLVHTQRLEPGDTFYMGYSSDTGMRSSLQVTKW